MTVKGMIFILNPNPIRLSLYESWPFNMVSKPILVGDPRFKPHFSIYSPFADLKVYEKLFDLFDSPQANMGPHLR